MPQQEPYQIRRMLTEGAVRASDKRARFVGIDGLRGGGRRRAARPVRVRRRRLAAGPCLLDRLVAEKLEREAEAVRAEGWRWVEVAPDFPYGHTYGLRRLRGKEVPLTPRRRARARDALQGRARQAGGRVRRSRGDPRGGRRAPGRDRDGAGGVRGAAASSTIPAEIARAGVFVSIDSDGDLHVERGYVRPEDEEPVGRAGREEARRIRARTGTSGKAERRLGDLPMAVLAVGHPAAESDEEDEGFRPLSDRLMTELTAHRTLALREAVANDPDTAFLAILHALCLKLFYRYGLDTCLEVDAKSVLFGAQARASATRRTPGDRRAARRWSAQLPKEPARPLGCAVGLDGDSRQALFAHCVGLTVNAVHQPYDRRPQALAHADRLAEAVAARHGGGRLAPDRGQLSRPRHQGPHPRSRARGQGRAGGPADRGPQEGRDGARGRAPARRHRLAARAAAHARVRPPAEASPTASEPNQPPLQRGRRRRGEWPWPNRGRDAGRPPTHPAGDSPTRPPGPAGDRRALFLSEATMPDKVSELARRLAEMPRRSAAITSPTGAARAATGWSAMSATRPAGRCIVRLSGRSPATAPPANGPMPPPASMAICST